MSKVPAFDRLAEALRERIRVIRDHAWRDRDGASHLAALREVSERIVALQNELPQPINPTLQHYLSRHSYEKALAYLEAETKKQPTR